MARFLLCCLVVALVVPQGRAINGAPPNPLGWEEVHPDGDRTQRLFFIGNPASGQVQVVNAQGDMMERDEATGRHRELSSYQPDETDVTAHQLHCTGQEGSDWCPDAFSEQFSLMRRSGNQGNQVSGVYRLLVLLVRFQDQQSRPMPSRENVETLFHTSNDQEITPTGSIRDFFKKQSFNKLNVVATVRDWMTISGTEEDYSHGKHGMTPEFGAQASYEVLEQMDSEGYDWSIHDQNGDGSLDGVLILHSGFAAEASGTPDCITGKIWGPHRIWSHQTVAGGDKAWRSKDEKYRIGRYATSSAVFGDCGSRCARIGVVGHEITHLFGVPDMIGTKGLGVGFYDVMGNSWGPDGTQLYPGTMSPWVREQLGWAEAESLSSNGVYQLRAAQDAPDLFRIDVGFPEGEFLYVENRQKKAYDSALPTREGGILVWHVSIPKGGSVNKWQSVPGWPGQPGWPGNGNHFQVALLSPDGQLDLELGTNLADRFDFWKDGMILGPGPASPSITAQDAWLFPNTDSYMNGDIRSTGVSLSEFSASGDIMSFRLTVDGTSVRPIEKISFGSSSFTQGYDPADPNMMFGQDIQKFSDYGGGIKGASADAAYATHVWSTSDFGYVLRLQPNRLYDVTLGFAESFRDDCKRGTRRFSAQAGSKRVDDIDVFALAGCQTMYKVRITEVSPNSSGDLLVMLFEGVGHPFLSVLEVIETPGRNPEQSSTPSSVARDVQAPIIKRVQFGSESTVDGYEPPTQSDFLSPVSYFYPQVAIKGTDADSAYAGHVYTQGGIFYVLRLEPNTHYDVKLGFAESFQGNCVVGGRVFSASVGERKLSTIDVYDAVGCRTAYDIMFKDIKAHTNGNLLVVVAERVENPYLSLLEVSLSSKPFIKLHFGSVYDAGEYGVPDISKISGSYESFEGHSTKVLGTADPGAYSGHVFSHDYVGYQLTLNPSKRYDVVLGFSETFEPNCSIGSRLFSVTVGDRTMTDIDVFAAVGCKMPYDIKFSSVSPSSNGELTIKVDKGKKENPFLSVLEVSLAQ